MKIINRISNNAYKLAALSFFVPLKLQVFLLFICTVVPLLTIIINKQNISKKEYLTAFLLGSIYFLYLVYIPFAGVNLHVLLFLCEKKLSLILLPFTVLFINKATENKPAFNWLFFVYACVAACFVANLYILIDYIIHQPSVLFHVYYRQYFEKLTNTHPTYMGIYIAFSICVLLYRFQKNLIPQKYISAHIALFFLLLIFLLFLSPKMPLVALLLIGLYVFLNSKFSLQKYFILLSFLAIVASGYFLIPSFQQRWHETSNFISKTENSSSFIENSLTTRKIIYEIDMNMLGPFWLKGTGPGNLQAYLDNYYFYVSVNTKTLIPSYNTHNEYLNFWLSFGIIGILFFVGLLFFHFRKAYLSGNILYTYFLVLICCCFLTENLLDRQRGVVFFALLAAYFWQENENFEKIKKIFS